MMTFEKELAIQKICEMSVERVSKVLIFMSGMEAEHFINLKVEKEVPSVLCHNKKDEMKGVI